MLLDCRASSAAYYPFTAIPMTHQSRQLCVSPTLLAAHAIKLHDPLKVLELDVATSLSNDGKHLVWLLCERAADVKRASYPRRPLMGLVAVMG